MCRRVRIVNLEDWEALIEKAKEKAPELSEDLDAIKNFEFEVKYIFYDFPQVDGSPTVEIEKTTHDALRIRETDVVDYRYHNRDYRDNEQAQASHQIGDK